MRNNIASIFACVLSDATGEIISLYFLFSNYTKFSQHAFFLIPGLIPPMGVVPQGDVAVPYPGFQSIIRTNPRRWRATMIPLKNNPKSFQILNFHQFPHGKLVADSLDSRSTPISILNKLLNLLLLLWTNLTNFYTNPNILGVAMEC